MSEHRWSASVIGYYERGKRTITVSTLCELARFYGVRTGYLLGDESGRHTRTDGPGVQVVLHRPTLASVRQAAPVDRFARWVATSRAESGEAEWLAVRSSDLRVIAAALDRVPAHTVAMLREWGCEVSDSAADALGAAPQLSRSAG